MQQSHQKLDRWNGRGREYGYSNHVIYPSNLDIERKHSLLMIAPGQQASIGTVPDKQGLITVLGVGSIETISKDFFLNVGKVGQEFGSGKCLG